MDHSSSFIQVSNPSTYNNYSFSSSFSQFPTQIRLKTPKFSFPNSRNFHVLAVAVDPQQELPKNSPQRLLKELSERKRATSPKKKVPPKRFILRPPLDDKRLAQRFLNSPQLSLKSFPLLSSCLPSSRLNNADKAWIEEYMLEAKQALGYPLEPSDRFGDDNPAKQFDTLLYMAFQHPSCERTNARHVRSAHSRLWFLGQYVLELGLAEFFLQRYPREAPGPMRERVFGLIGKRNLPRWIKAASLQNLVFPFDDMDKLQRKDREPPVKSVFWALFGAIYLCFGMPEVYRVLFEVFGMDPEAEDCQPKLRRQLEDVDYVSVEFEGKKLSWQDVAGYKLSFLHPSKHKFEHPRFCYERLEYVGQKIQDLVMAERLLMKHLDAPGKWLAERHRRVLMNKFCGRYLREKRLHQFIIYSDQVQDAYEHNRRLRNPATTAVQQAIHGLSYTIYGKPDVRRLMFEVFDFEQTQPKAVTV
ncbi:ribonuclease III domain-containing protein RNC1, chloroplastic isoform X2 [Prunus dulcis]|uniref:ribonuclease III domain-containing protein RNC1, chloroplastic isoform X2 n=1 Tax=Prunus dulcis TaxID=3755 RepID=UPI0014839DC8|nr:ribonuclease III domain-containing protein RNC1, chloroplastic isoform X2 [Prunus dulcis]